MKTAIGKPKFDAIFLGEVTLNVLAFPDVHLSATAGYVDSKSGRRFGSMTKLGGWSLDTLRKLNEFLEALESDVAADVFEGGATGGGEEPLTTTTDGIPGL